MELIKTANKTKIKMSKSEWEGIGKKAGWMDDVAGSDAINDLVNLANTDPRRFRELLRDNEDICEDLIGQLHSQNVTDTKQKDALTDKLENYLDGFGKR